MHGGLSPDLNSMEQIRRVMRPTDVCRSLYLNNLNDAIYESGLHAALSFCGDLLTSLDPGLRPFVRPFMVRS